MLEAIATEPRLMPHLHLSLQAGDDLILKRMKRRHLLRGLGATLALPLLWLNGWLLFGAFGAIARRWASTWSGTPTACPSAGPRR